MRISMIFPKKILSKVGKRFYSSAKYILVPYILVSRKQKNGGSVEQFHTIVKDLAEHCVFDTGEDAITYNNFFTNRF